MKFAKICLRAASRMKNGSYFGSLKSIAIRFLSYKQGKPLSVKSRIFNFVKLNAIIFSLPFRMKRVKDKSVLGLFVEDSNIKERIYFINRFSSEKLPGESMSFYFPTRRSDKLVFTEMSFEKWMNLIHSKRRLRMQCQKWPQTAS